MHDLTEVRRSESRTQQLQSELAHISRLSALGEMGSALAHELNQPLAAVANYITGSRRLLADAPGPAAAKIEGALERAAEQVMRAGQIIRRLRDFVSRRAVERSPSGCPELVEEASALGLVGAREKGVGAQVPARRAHDLVFADRVQIEQVLVNLLRNGLDSMEERRAARADGVEPPASARPDRDRGLRHRRRHRARTRWRGCSIRSSPPRRRGSASGLSISRGIVEAHGGEMWAENNAGRRRDLPLHAAPARGRRGMSGKGLVYIVDDDEAVRDSLDLLLSSAGLCDPDVRVRRGVSRLAARGGARLPVVRHPHARHERDGAAGDACGAATAGFRSC